MKKNTAYTTRDTDLTAPVSKMEIRNSRRESKIKRTTRKSNQKDTIREEPSETNKPKTKIYVYVQLKEIQNVPEKKGPVEIELMYGGEVIQRLDTECCKQSIFDLRKDKLPTTFSFPIVQDSIDDLNMVSDHPIIISLFERVQPDENAMEEGEDEYRKVIAQGFIDLLGYFTKKRFSTVLETFIYPTDKKDQINFGTCKAIWHIYALLPLLKNVDFSNIVFLNFESLYNVSEDLMDDPEDLMAILAFRSLVPNELGEYETNKVCSFSGFTKSIIKEQNPYFTWEAAKSNENFTGKSFGLQSDSKVNIYKLFKRLLRPENVELSFRDITLEADEALTCNSMHRFVLTEELRALLEDVFVFRQQQLIVQLYRVGAPEDILLEGIIEPSVLLYPFVNAVRFAVVLNPPMKRESLISNTAKSKRKSRFKDSLASGDIISKPLFGIVSMCLLTPISESVESLANYTQGVKREKIKFCRRIQSEVIMAPYALLSERAYDNYDEWIIDLVDYILKNNIRDISDARNFFCCQAENGSNKILKLVALDFNQRFSTKDNIEFCNLMTTVYKELVERANNYIKSCGSKDLSRCRKFGQESQKYIITIMNFIKFAYDANNNNFGDILFSKLKERYAKNVDYNFFTFLYNVELGNFTEAKTYFLLSPKDRRLQDEYIIRILDIYIQYMENLQNEEIFNEAYEKLLQNLREFLKYFHKDTDGWILLYCLYKRSGYLPGMEFARWHYEDLYDDSPHRQLEYVPMTRWRIFCNYEIPFTSVKAIHFYDSVKLFQSIGAYKFAEIIFNEIATECSDVERYLITTSLKIFLKELDPSYPPRMFPTAKAGPLKAFLYFVNGNLSYSLEDFKVAQEYYKYLADIVDDDDFDMSPFELGIRRHAYQSMAQQRWEEAIASFGKCCNLNGSCMLASIAMGQILYKLGRYVEALEHFKYSTEYKIHIPNVWAYLALINLKLGNNFNALECWKYAKLNPANVIDDEILEELFKINKEDIDLYVDRPV